MGTVTSLAEFRNKKSCAEQMRPMTTEEWIDYLNSPDLLSPGWIAKLQAREQAAVRCIGLLKKIADFNLVRHYGRYRFSHAFQRSLLKVELAELVKEHELTQFNLYL